MDVRIRIRQAEEGEYLVEIEAPMVVGELSDGKISNDRENQLNELLERLNALVYESEVDGRDSIEPIDQCLEEIGSILFECLDQTDGRMRRILDVATHKVDEPLLRLELRIRDQRVASWPWELLFDQESASKNESRESGFLALSPDITISRYHELPIPIAEPEVLEQLRVLVITETENDAEIEQLARENIAALRLLTTKRALHVDVLENVSLTALAGHLLVATKPYHIIHFIGHGRFEPPVTQLIFSDGVGGTTAVNAEKFAEVLQKSEELRLKMRKETPKHSRLFLYPRLIILDACHSANMQYDVVSVTNELVGLGIPAVIGMRQSVSAIFTFIFNDELYAHLLDGRPIDLAVTLSRKATHLKFRSMIDWEDPRLRNRVLDWTVPLLHLRAVRGILFQPKAVASENMRRHQQIQLIEALASEQAAEAAQALLDLGASALVLLLSTTLTHPTALVRKKAAQLVQSIPRTSNEQEEIVQFLGPTLLEESDLNVRREVARLIAQPTISANAEAYLQLLADNTDSVLREISLYTSLFQQINWFALTEGLNYLREQIENVSNSIEQLLQQVQRALQENQEYETYIQSVETALQQARVLKEQITHAQKNASQMSGDQMVEELYPSLDAYVSSANNASLAARDANKNVYTLAESLTAILGEVEKRLEYESSVLRELQLTTQELDKQTIISKDGLATIKILLQQIDIYQDIQEEK